MRSGNRPVSLARAISAHLPSQAWANTIEWLFGEFRQAGYGLPDRAADPTARATNRGEKGRNKMKSGAGELELPEHGPVCGIVMPISAIDGCAESHWADVLEILSEAIDAAGFVPNVVSNADDVGIIQKRIIQNLYDNPIVVCDVSGKNPNVMFELGLRLAFDKPTIIVKDDKTAYSFDTSPIEHLDYPRDLRFSRIVDFKTKVSAKIQATHQKSTSDPSYTTFLKHFGEFTVAKLDKKEVSGQEYILEELRSIRTTINRLDRIQGGPGRNMRPSFAGSSDDLNVCLKDRSDAEIDIMRLKAVNHPKIGGVAIVEYGDHKHLLCEVRPGTDPGLEVELFGQRRRHGQPSVPRAGRPVSG